MDYAQLGHTELASPYPQPERQVVAQSMRIWFEADTGAQTLSSNAC